VADHAFDEGQERSGVAVNERRQRLTPAARDLSHQRLVAFVHWRPPAVSILYAHGSDFVERKSRGFISVGQTFLSARAFGRQECLTHESTPLRKFLTKSQNSFDTCPHAREHVDHGGDIPK